MTPAWKKRWGPTRLHDGGLVWDGSRALPEGLWFRLVPRHLEWIEARFGGPINPLLYAPWAQLSVARGDGVLLGEELLAAALELDTPGLTFQQVPHYGPATPNRMWEVHTTSRLGPIVEGARVERDDPDDYEEDEEVPEEVVVTHPVVIDGTAWGGAGFAASSERIGANGWRAFYARRDWLEALVQRVAQPLDLQLQPVTVRGAAGPLQTAAVSALPPLTALSVPPLADRVKALHDTAARYNHRLGLPFAESLQDRATRLGLAPPAPGLLALADQLGAAELFCHPHGSNPGLRLLSSLEEWGPAFAAEGEFQALPGEYLPFALTSPSVAWGCNAEGLVCGAGNELFRYGMPTPLDEWLHRYVLTLQQAYDDENALPGFFQGPD